MERVVETQCRFAARPLPACAPRSQEADHECHCNRQNGLKRDPRAARDERRHEHQDGPEDEEAGQEAPDRREPVREGLEEGQQRPLERPRGLGRDEARQRDQTGCQDNDIRRPSHADLAGGRSVEPRARPPHAHRRGLALRPGRGARASRRGHLFGFERVGAGHAVSAPSLRLIAENSAESTPRLHGEGAWRAAGRAPRVSPARVPAPHRRRDRLRRAHRSDPAHE